MKRDLQPALSDSQQADRHLDLADQIGDPASPYLLADEAARYLRFSSAVAFRHWAHRQRVPVQRRGRTLLYARPVLDAFVSGKAWTLMHGSTVKAFGTARKGHGL